MPFKSKAQARYLFAKEPAVAKEFLAKTPGQHPIKALPERVGKKSSGKVKALPMRMK